MARQIKRNRAGVARVHNPKFPLALQTKGTNKVAAKASNPKRRKKSRRRNSTKPAAATSARRNPTRTVRAAAKNPAKRAANPRRRRTGSKRGRRNPFRNGLSKLAVGDFGIKDILGVAAGAMGSQIIVNALPLGTPGSWLNIGEQLGIAYAVSKFAPRSIRKSMTAGALAAPAVAIVNKLVPNLQSKIQSYLPQVNLLGSGAAASGAGIAGLVDYRPYPGMSGLVDVAAGSPAYY
jgi:hypothetical protein